MIFLKNFTKALYYFLQIYLIIPRESNPNAILAHQEVVLTLEILFFNNSKNSLVFSCNHNYLHIHVYISIKIYEDNELKRIIVQYIFVELNPYYYSSSIKPDAFFGGVKCFREQNSSLTNKVKIILPFKKKKLFITSRIFSKNL